MESAHAWQQYYRAERTRMGAAALLALVDDARPLDVRADGAIVIPHTRMEVTGHQIATAVATVLASGVDTVLALGVLHGARRVDRERVAAARSGDAEARAELRGVHDEHGVASEEFSLDGFRELLDLAAERSDRSIEVVRRYPFLVGDDPGSLPGLHELRQVLADGAMLVVTTDPIHHGHAYGTPEEACMPAGDPVTIDVARSEIEAQFEALSEHRFGDFAALAEHHRSDFRDTGPTMAALVGAGFDPVLHDLELVDYAEALDAPRPTWVAGALVTL